MEGLETDSVSKEILPDEACYICGSCGENRVRFEGRQAKESKRTEKKPESIKVESQRRKVDARCERLLMEHEERRQWKVELGSSR